jgi:hypothetical protein
MMVILIRAVDCIPFHFAAVSWEIQRNVSVIFPYAEYLTWTRYRPNPMCRTWVLLSVALCAPFAAVSSRSHYCVASLCWTPFGSVAVCRWPLDVLHFIPLWLIQPVIDCRRLSKSVVTLCTQWQILTLCCTYYDNFLKAKKEFTNWLDYCLTDTRATGWLSVWYADCLTLSVPWYSAQQAAVSLCRQSHLAIKPKVHDRRDRIPLLFWFLEHYI